MNRNYWQHSAGDTDRNYAEICLKWDVILNGPGYAGAWPDCAEKLRLDKCSSRKVTDLERFSEKMKDGDIVVLRLGVLGIFRPKTTKNAEAPAPQSLQEGITFS